MGAFHVRRACAAVLAASLLPAPAGAQSAPGPASRPPAGQATPATEGPAALDRIRTALEQAPQAVIRMPETPAFNVVIEGKLPSFENFVTPGELSAYVMPTAMTHTEYLDAVTPPEARLFASSVNSDLVQVVATSMATSMALSLIAEALRKAFRSGKEKDAKQEVQAVLDDLRRRDSTPAPAAPPPDLPR